MKWIKTSHKLRFKEWIMIKKIKLSWRSELHFINKLRKVKWTIENKESNHLKWTTNSKEYKILKWTISVINLDSQVNQRFEKNPIKTSELEV